MRPPFGAAPAGRLPALLRPLPGCAALALCTALLLPTASASAASKVSARAQAIAQNNLIIDTHIDVPYRLHRQPADVGAATDDGEFDYPRARAGGLNAPFMSVYIPASTDAEGGAYSFANDTIASVRQIVSQHPDKFAIATCANDLVAHQAAGLISLPMGMENGGPIDGQLDNLRHFYQAGIRYITLAHSKANHISDSSYDSERPWQGLSPFGQTLVAHMNRLGVMIDVSHISDAAFWQVLALSQTPVIASHSSLRHFTPGFERNMTDAMVRAMAAQGGVIQINYGSSFVHQAARDWSNQRTLDVQAFAEAEQLPLDDPKVQAYLAAYRDTHPYPFASLDQVLDHFDRVVEIAGIDAVGIGSDYDGVGDSLPDGLKDVASYPRLVQGLLDRGYSETDIIKVLGGNTLRVWRAVEDYARSQGQPVQCSATSGLQAVRTLPAPTPVEDEFHFVVLGDAQFHSPARFNRVIDQVRQLQPALVVQVGDLIRGYNDDLAAVRQEWQRFKRQIQPLAPIAYYAVPGNHDVYGADRAPDAQVQAVFEEEIGPSYFKFEYKNALFVGLNSDAPEAPEAISPAQVAWLTQVLQASNARHRFLFMHRPPLLMKNAKALHKLFGDHGVTQVFYGHHHHYHHRQIDGVGYTMTNASGNMGHDNPLVGGFHNLLQVSVRGDAVDVAVIEADAIHALDSVRPEDNYDMFALVRDLAPKEIALQADGDGYSLQLPLNNTTQRKIQVFVSCGSADDRWQLTPQQVQTQTLPANRDRQLKLAASFDPQRQPEGAPFCDLRVPLQTRFGDWVDYTQRVQTTR